MTTIKEYKAMMEGATPAPWDTIKADGFTAIAANTLIARVWSTAFKDLENEKANADFICTSRELAPELIRVIELAEEKLQFIARHNTNDRDKNELAVFRAAIDVLSEIVKLKGE